MTSKDFEWYVKADLSQYKGQYVIIRDKKVLYHGSDMHKLLQQFRKQYPKEVPKVAKIPTEETLVLWL